MMMQAYLVHQGGTARGNGRMVGGSNHSSPALSVIILNFEVFAEIFQHSAYDSAPFRSFFSVLSNVCLEVSPPPESDHASNFVSGVNHFTQANIGGRSTCVLEEMNAAEGLGTGVAQLVPDGGTPVITCIPRRGCYRPQPR
jgi:hypothetical protein